MGRGGFGGSSDWAARNDAEKVRSDGRTKEGVVRAAANREERSNMEVDNEFESDGQNTLA